jgi:hypothetical protein
VSIIDPPKSRFLFGLIVGAALAATVATVLQLPARKQRTLAASYLLEGYDFSGLRSKDNVWRGPQVGEKINLANLIERNGSTLENTIQQGPVMIATVSAACEFCKLAKDQMQFVQSHVALKNVKYYFVSFEAREADPNFYRFCDALNSAIPAFRWSNDVSPPQESLSKIVTPAHLLVDRDGTVLEVWPGTSREQAVRDGMARQIVNDVSVILDTLDSRTSTPNKPQ